MEEVFLKFALGSLDASQQGIAKMAETILREESTLGGIDRKDHPYWGNGRFDAPPARYRYDEELSRLFGTPVIVGPWIFESELFELDFDESNCAWGE